MSKHLTHWTLLGLGLAAGAGFSLSAMAGSDDVSTGISDSAITAKVKATLADDSQLQGADIHVKTDTRVVTLNGKVVSDAQRRDAVRTTEDVRGVDSVDDELSIAAGPVTAHPEVAKAERVGSDSWITTKVKLELVGDTDTRGFDIHVKTLHGVVMLQGSLPTEHDVEHVCDVAGQVQGVRRVDSSELRISGGG
ncbi:MAG TPA: BON domain-containing protein [Steroidobacteraceae bacterium]|nr:BON domain-containing protein [Steroidobacteraceae bacterium]